MNGITERLLAAMAEESIDDTSSILGTGVIERIERGLPPLLGCRHGLALPSGTMALRVALQAVGVDAQDEVIVPAVDWLSSVATVRSLGAVPVPVEVVMPDRTIHPHAVDRAITSSTRAVIATHLGGVPADGPAIQHVCRSHGIALVEDCAQALGATVDGCAVGSFGDAAIVSFGPNKTIDAGGGGMLVTRSAELWRRAISLSQHPARQLAAGIVEPNPEPLEARVHPVAALLVAHDLRSVADRITARHEATRQLVQVARDRNLVPPEVSDRACMVGDSIPVLAGATIQFLAA